MLCNIFYRIIYFHRGLHSLPSKERIKIAIKILLLQLLVQKLEKEVLKHSIDILLERKTLAKNYKS